MSAQPFTLAEFGGRPAKPKAEAPAPGQAQGQAPPPEAQPAPKRARLDDGFLPLMLGSKQEDPRAVAQREADQMLAEAKTEAQRIREQAYEEGFAQGQEDGLSAGRAKIEAAADNLGRALAALDQATDQVLATLEGEIVALVMAAGEAVWAMEGAVDPRAVNRVVAQAIAAAGDAAELQVKVSAADLGQVEAFRPELLERFRHLTRLEITADPQMPAGGCLVSSANTLVDATLENRRERIYAALAQRLKQGPALDMAPLAPRPENIPDAGPARAAAAPEPAAPAAEPPAEAAPEPSFDDDGDPLPELEESW